MVSCSAVATADFLMNSCFYIELSKHNFISLSFVTFALKKMKLYIGVHLHSFLSIFKQQYCSDLYNHTLRCLLILQIKKVSLR